MVSRFEELEVYQKSYKLALEIHKLTLGFPAIEQFALSSQMRRASKSICANIAEGFAKHYSSSAEFKRYLAISIGSSNEMQVWVSFSCDLEYIDTITAEELKNKYIEIGKMLFVLSKNWKN